VALADATITVGQSFTAPLDDGSLQAYTKDSGVLATPVGLPFPTAAAVSRKADAQIGKNLFNPADPGVMVGYYISATTGLPVTVAGFRTTGFIAVVAGASYAISAGRQLAWYGPSLSYVSGFTPGSAVPLVISAPAGASFLRTSASDGDLALYQIEAGTVGTSYAPYAATLVNPLGANAVATNNLVDSAVTEAKLGAGAVSSLKLVDGAVTPAKASFFKLGKNLFDKTTVIADFYVNNVTGLLSANTAYYTSDYIPVTPGVAYAATAATGTGIRFTSYYNAAKEFVAGGANSTITSFTPPAGAAFIRITIYKDTLNALQVEVGAATAYEAYKFAIDSAYIPAVTAAAAVPELILPPAIYGVQGRECNVYLDNLFPSTASDYCINVDSAGSVGKQQDERWTWTPAGALTTGNLTISAHDKRSGDLLVTKTAIQRAAAATAGSGLNKKVMIVGDSLVNAGVIGQTLIDIAATDAMGITLLGTRTTGTAANKHEGRGGWSIGDYSTAGRNNYSFTVSSVTTPPALNSTTYTNNGNTYTVQEIALTGGAGTIVCSVDPLNGAPLASGTLTKGIGSGDATIAFSAFAVVPGNPFWRGGALNFTQYLTDFAQAVPDWVLISLGINDVFGYTSDGAASAAADSGFTQLDALITSIKAAGAGIKVGIVIPTPPAASQDAFGTAYATGQSRWRDKRNILIWARQLIAKYAGQEASRIYLVPSNVALDAVNGYPRDAAVPVSSRNPTITINRQSNGVHPADSGYQQIGDATWAFLKYFA
jgi:lysophospholipase L1-like esterase